MYTERERQTNRQTETEIAVLFSHISINQLEHLQKKKKKRKTSKNQNLQKSCQFMYCNFNR